MEYINNQLCISHAELTDGIASKSLIDKWQSKGKVNRIQRGCNGTPAMFAVDSLPSKYKIEVYRRNPDLKAQSESKPFIESIEPDGAALNFYEEYQLANSKYLPTDKQEECANNAAILNTFRAALEKSNSERAKQSHKQVNKAEFWAKAARALPRIADKFPHSLPENARRLQEKFNQYQREGYAALITGKYGTRNAASVNDETKESLLIKLMSLANNLNNEQVAGLYNTVAKQLNWKCLTGSAIDHYRKKYGLITEAGRLGASRFYNQKSMQVKRSRPTLPLLYWTLDGWTAELLYQRTEERNGRNITTYTNRLTLVLVLDPCTNYPIGYAIGERETPVLIKEALREAANHTAELFGTRYRANQIQSDNYGRGALTPIYKVMGDKYTPAKVHNAKSKVIEPYFGYFNEKYCKLCSNWSGYGITSNKNLQPNSEFLNKNRKKFPDAEHCRLQLEAFIGAERESKRAKYVSLFAELPEERRLSLSDEQYLLNFGADTGFKNALEGNGLRPTIGGVKRDYDCFNPKFREYAHIRWSIKYDENDLSRVLAVNEDGSLRFMLENKYIQPMALAERKEGDAEQLTRIQDFNRNQEAHIVKQLSAANDKVEQLFIDNPQLDISTRLLICDSAGQNKNNKQTRRMQAHEIETIAAIEVETVKHHAPQVEDDNIANLY